MKQDKLLISLFILWVVLVGDHFRPVASSNLDDNSIKFKELIEQWKSYFRTSLQLNVFYDRFKNLTGNNSNNLNTSAECLNALDIYFQDPFEYDWTIKMWDSNGHFPSGILIGTFYDPGNFDECLSIKSENDHIRGKYCILEIKLPDLIVEFNNNNNNNNETQLLVYDKKEQQLAEVINFLIQWHHYSGVDNGICLPSTCTDDEINQIVPQVFIQSELNLHVRTKLCQDRTTEIINRPLRFGQKLAIVIIVVHVLLALVGTILSRFQHFNDSTSLFAQTMDCFCWIKNTRTLFRVRNEDQTSRPPPNEPNLKFIHGLRVFSIYWILVSHVFLFYPFLNVEDRVSPVQSLEKRLNVIRNPFTHFIVNAGLAVETFFLISGALTVCSVLLINQNRSFNIFNYVFLRWIRFSPATLGAMCLLILWPIIGDGPLFHPKYIDFITEPCYKNWWISFVYVANLYPHNQVCNVMHWYLSADFQMHILLYVVIFFYHKHLFISIFYTLLMILIGFITPIIIVLAKWSMAPNPSIFLHPNYQFPMDKVETFIFATWNHLIPYFIGSLFGLILVRRKTINIPSVRRWFIWFTLFPLFLLLPFSSYTFVDSTEPVDIPLQSSIIFGIIRIIWSLGILWLCLECSQKRAHFIRKFLSADIFVPFSRLSFTIYLVHIFPIWHYIFTIRQPIDVSLYNLLFIGIGNAVLSTGLAYLLYCLFECPYTNIIKKFLKKEMSRSDDNEQRQRHHHQQQQLQQQQKYRH